MRIYELSIRYPTADAVVPEGEKITEATLTSALEGIPEDDMLLHHYLLWAAARMRHQTDADDTRRTAPKRVESFFATRSPYHEALERTLGPGITPLKLQIRGKDNDKQRGASLFEPVVMKSAGELQARVERISCGFPPFLHYVPFWLHNEIKV